MPMIAIAISQLFGSACVDADDGTALGDRIRDGLSRDDCVLLDFEGVGTVTGSFLNTALGCLYSAPQVSVN